MLGRARDRAVADDLAARIHGADDAAVLCEPAEVEHPACLCPEEACERVVAREVAVSGDPPAVLPRQRPTDPTERAEIDHPARLGPGERVVDVAGSAAVPDNLAVSTHRDGLAEPAAERA